MKHRMRVGARTDFEYMQLCAVQPHGSPRSRRDTPQVRVRRVASVRCAAPAAHPAARGTGHLPPGSPRRAGVPMGVPVQQVARTGLRTGL